jgi:hypothetical protein
MNLLVLPISAVTPTALSPLAVIHGVIGHALFVGLAAALSLRRYVRDEPATGGAPTRNRSEKFDESAA